MPKTPKNAAPTEQQRSDYKRLSTLIFEAARKAVEFMRGVSPPDVRHPVYVAEKEFREDWLVRQERLLPNYTDPSLIAEARERYVFSEEAQALLDFVWDTEHLRAFSVPPDQDKEQWERSFIADMLYRTLFRALMRSAISGAIDGEEMDLWQLDESALRRIVDDWVDEREGNARGVRKLSGRCIFLGLGVDEEINFPLLEGMTLRTWPVKERLMYLSLYDNWLREDYFVSPQEHPLVVEIDLETPLDLTTHEILPLFADRLDLLKWATSIASGGSEVAREGPLLVFTRSGEFHDKIIRDHLLQSRATIGYRGLGLRADRLAYCRELMTDYTQLAARLPGIRQGLLHFGRSCTSMLDRDVLLDAAIGIEALVVHGPNDSRYRFRVHGACVLWDAFPARDKHSLYELLKAAFSDKGGKEFYDFLGKLYDKRSHVAHGVGVSDNIFLDAYYARFCLRDILHAIIMLEKSTKITIKGEMTVGQIVEEYVVTKAIS